MSLKSVSILVPGRAWHVIVIKGVLLACMIVGLLLPGSAHVQLIDLHVVFCELALSAEHGAVRIGD